MNPRLTERDLTWGGDCEVCETRMAADRAQRALRESKDGRLLCGACRDEERMTAEVDEYREALRALVEAVETFFAPNSLGAPVWPRAVDGRKLLDRRSR